MSRFLATIGSGTLEIKSSAIDQGVDHSGVDPLNDPQINAVHA